MNEKIDGNIGRRSPRGLRQFFEVISLMANSPWGNGPKGGGDGDGSGDGKKPGPRNPWVTPDPIDINRGRKPRGPSALDELLRKGRSYSYALLPDASGFRAVMLANSIDPTE